MASGIPQILQEEGGVQGTWGPAESRGPRGLGLDLNKAGLTLCSPDPQGVRESPVRCHISHLRKKGLGEPGEFRSLGGNLRPSE